MKIRTLNKRWIILCFMATLVLIMCIVSAIHYSSQDAKAAEEKKQAALMAEQEKFDPNRYVYANETCYTGAPYLSDVLFSTPFGRTDDYICNNDFIALIGEDNAAMFADNAKNAAKALFDLSYQERDINDPVLSEILTDGLYVLFADGTFTESKEETIEAVNSWFIENQTSMEAEFYTDKCMVFYDDLSVIVRGQLVFTVYGGNDIETLQQYFGLESLEQGKEYAVILEMEFINKTNARDYAAYKLSGINLI